MNIVLIGGLNVPSQGGIENYIYNLSIKLIEKGHQVTIISRGREKKQFSVDGINIIQIKCKEAFYSIFLHNIIATLYIYKFLKNSDIAVYQSIFLPFLYEWLLHLRGIKTVQTVHSFAHDNSKHNKYKRWVIGRLYNVSGITSSPIITVSEHNKVLIRNRMYKTATVINCGVNMPKNCESMNILNEYNLTPNEYYLTIGRIDPVKNLDVLIKAFLRHHKSSKYKLVICGNYNNKYGEMLRKLAISDDRIIFTGAVEGENKDILLANAFAFCMVSSSEGFPIALLEAMAHANVCICSSIPAILEVMHRDDMGILCEANNPDSLWEQMNELESNYHNYQNMRSRVSEYIMENLTWQKVSDKYESFLYSCVDNK